MTSPRSSTERARRLRLVWLIAALGIALGGSGRARAVPSSADDGCLRDPVCSGHYERAVEHFEASRFDAALVAFQAAYNQRQMPWLLLNIGRTLHRLGRPRDALVQYERYRAVEPHPDPETQQRLQKYVSQARALVGPEEAEPGGVLAVRPAAASASASDARPVYKKAWFWALLGGGVVAVTVIGVAVGVGIGRAPDPLPSGVVVFRPSF